MVSRNLDQSINTIMAFDTGNINSDTTTDGDSIDLAGYESCSFLWHAATIADGTFTPVIEESDTGAFGGEENAVSDDDLTVTEASVALTAGGQDVPKILGYKGDKRYVRFTIASTGTSSGGTGFSAVCLRGHALQQPAAIS